MSKIIEVQPGVYHYKDWTGIESELDFVYLRGLNDDSYKCIKVDGKYGIIKDYRDVIADAVYSNIRCIWNRQNGIIDYFAYRIDVVDESGKEYKVYGKILLDGTVIQDAKLHYDNSSSKEYSLRIPRMFIFICHLFGKYYLYYHKYGTYGMLQFDINLQPYIIGSTEFNYRNIYDFKSFLYKDKWQLCICFFKNKGNGKLKGDDRECKWFVFSNVTQEARYIKDYDRIQSLWPVKSSFWWFKQDEYYGLIDPFLKVILPPIYNIDREDFSNIDYVIARNPNGKWGVLKIRENSKSPEWEDRTINADRFYKKFEYEVYIPFDFKGIYRSGNYLTIENNDKKQYLYSLVNNCSITSSVFSNEWFIMPQTIGENLVGAFLKGFSTWRVSELPNLKYVFLDINTGETIIEFPNDIFIKRGFKGGKAIVESTNGNMFRVDKNGNLYKLPHKKGSLCELDEEEDYGNPNMNEDELENFYGMTDGQYGDYPDDGHDGDYEYFG
jgi:hypothetical protein